MSVWKGGLWGSQRHPNGNGPWRGGLWASQRAGGGGTDWSSVSIGDEVEGGIYAGTITYGDAREYHIILADVAGTDGSISWGFDGVETGVVDPDDGKANTDALVTQGGGPAVDHCVNYSAGGYGDWYLPAENELVFIHSNFAYYNTALPEFQQGGAQAFNEDYYWSSTEYYSGTSTDAQENAKVQNFADLANLAGYPKTSLEAVRPIRRVPV